MSVLRWFGRNLSTLIMAFILALIVWVSAVISEDPNQDDVLQRPVPIERIGLSPELLVVGNTPEQVRLTLNAPTSVWRRIRNDEDSVRAWIDLTGLGPGQHVRPIRVQVRESTARVISREPEEVEVVLERLVSQTYSVTLEIDGQSALGYEAGGTVYTPTQVTVSGAESLVSQVEEVVARLDIAGANQTINTTIALRAINQGGQTMSGVTITPDSLAVQQAIHLLGEYRNMIVRVVTTGQVANGYKLTNIVVTPPSVVVFSSNPQLLNQLPGYVETEPLNLDGAQDYLETTLDLDLPSGIRVVNDQRVLVQIFITPIESDLLLTLPVEVIGLSAGLEAQIVPAMVDITLSGPLTVLNALQASEIRVVVEVTGLAPGIYQLEPRIASLPARVILESILPATVEVTIFIAPTPTSTATPLETLTVTPTPSP